MNQSAEYSEAVRSFVANALRIAAGAGDPHALPKQAIAFLNAYDALRRNLPDDQCDDTLVNALGGWKEDWKEDSRTSYFRMREDEIIREAMRVVAARLIGPQILQRRHESEFTSTLRGYANAVEEEVRDQARNRRLVDQERAKEGLWETGRQRATRQKKNVVRIGHFHKSHSDQ